MLGAGKGGACVGVHIWQDCRGALIIGSQPGKCEILPHDPLGLLSRSTSLFKATCCQLSNTERLVAGSHFCMLRMQFTCPHAIISTGTACSTAVSSILHISHARTSTCLWSSKVDWHAKGLPFWQRVVLALSISSSHLPSPINGPRCFGMDCILSAAPLVRTTCLGSTCSRAQTVGQSSHRKLLHPVCSESNQALVQYHGRQRKPNEHAGQPPAAPDS